MVKPDVKHNYYADLELPTTASIDDVRKAYRKLALQYHPDRNAGKEGECVPKFQAIQQANEVLADVTTKQKYDMDRRKAGLYPAPQTGFTPRQPTPGNPYAAQSAYPPPPRRTQAGTWQRPPPAANAGANAGASGADRFSNFPRPSPTAKKDPSADRANMFHAWQNMNNPQSRQSRPVPPQPAPQPQPQAQPQPQTARRGPPPPPPRQGGAMPSEEQIRAGTKYRGPPPTFDTDLNEKQRSWQAFEQNGPSKPGINRSNTTRTPKRQGFNPNTPGSDERAAPRGSSYVHRNKSADFGRPMQYPPLPPGAPPTATTPTSPLSPNDSPKHARPSADPTRPDRTNAPFTEGTRNRTPYASFIGERTDFSGEKMRRSYSVRDSTRLGPEDAANRNRARSSSPHRTQDAQSPRSTRGKPFMMYSSSSASSSSSDMASPEQNGKSTEKQRPGTAPETPLDRPKMAPTPPSSRLNAMRGGPASPPPMPGTPNVNVNGKPAEGMQQKNRPNMYANPSLFDQKSWLTAMFGSYSTSRAKLPRHKMPQWAIPASVNPSLRREKAPAVEGASYTTGADRDYICASKEEREAYLKFQNGLSETFHYIPGNLAMGLFLTLISECKKGNSSGRPDLDILLSRILNEFPTIGGEPASDTNTDNAPRADSFSFANTPDLFTSKNAKSRSDDHINTNFSPDGWHGTFTGEPDYFAPPQSNAKSHSPLRRPVISRNPSSQRRAATMDEGPTTGTASNEMPQRPWGSDGQPKDVPIMSPPESGFSTTDWQEKFQDPSWTMPPPPPNPPSPSKFSASAAGSRRPSRTLGKKKGQTFASHVDGVTVEVDDDQGKQDSAAPAFDDGDAMDIDTPPQRQDPTSAPPDPQSQSAEKEATLYSVPPSAWRQQQEQAQQPNGRHRKTSSASRRAQRASASAGGSGTKLNTTLDDLRNVEPIAKTAHPSGAGGGFNTMSNMFDGLPFTSGTSHSAIPQQQETLHKLDLPQIPTIPKQPSKWTKLSWHHYAEDFADYLKRRHDFNKRMLGYFATRSQEDDKLIGGGNLAWLEAKGDTTQGVGWEAFKAKVGEEERMREVWGIECEGYGRAVKEFGEGRERVRGLVERGVLGE